VHFSASPRLHFAVLISKAPEFAELRDRRAEILWRGTLDRHLISTGMNESEFLGVQSQPGDQRALVLSKRRAVIPFVMTQKNSDCRAAGRRVVNRIDRQRQSNRLQMHPDLMRAAGFGNTPEQRKSTEVFSQCPVCARGFAVFGNAHPIRAGWMRREWGVNFALVLRRFAVDQGEIFLLDLVVLELVGDMPLGCDVFGHEQHAAGFFVEAMDDSQPGVGGPRTRQSCVPREHLQNAVGLGATRDSGQMRGFGDGDQAVVLKEDGQFGVADTFSPVDGGFQQFYYEPL
jgi:hypothetical protein